MPGREPVWRAFARQPLRESREIHRALRGEECDYDPESPHQPPRAPSEHVERRQLMEQRLVALFGE